MRNPNRIDPMIEQLREFWHKNPDWRLAQLVCNAAREGTDQPALNDPFYVEDDDLALGIKRLDQWF